MNTKRRPISSLAAAAALALAASSAAAQTLVYNFAQLYDSSNNPDPAGTYPDDFQANGSDTTISQSTIGVPAGSYSMQFQQTSAASFTGALTTVIPEIINDPATTAISFDVTIPSTGNFTGNYANIGISEFGTNSMQLGSTNAIQVQTISSSEVSLNLAPGSYAFTIPLIALYNPITGDPDVPFSNCFGSDTNSQLEPTGFEFYINKSTDSALNVYISNVEAIGQQTVGTWNNAAGGSWATSGNWTGGIPKLALDTANFGSAITASSTVTLDGNWSVGTLTFDNAHQYTIAQGTGGGTLTLDGGGSPPIGAGGGAITSFVTDSGGTHTISAPVDINSNAQFSVANAGDTLNVTGAVSGVGSISIMGSGTVVFGGSNTYGTPTYVDSGTFSVANTTGSATGTNNVTMNGGVLASGATGTISGAVLPGTGSYTIAPGGIGHTGTLNVGGITTTGSTTIALDLGTTNGEVTNGDLLNLGLGQISIGSGTNLTFGGTAGANNSYRLIGGTLAGISLSNFSLPAAPADETYSLNTTIDPGYIDLFVSGIIWNNSGGSAPANGTSWDTTDHNWNNGSSAIAFSNGLAVTFTDNNNSNYAVTLSTTVSPSSVGVNNSASNYTITGTGKIADAGAFNKFGTGTAVIGTALSAGSVNITNGTVQLAKNTTLGSSSPASNINISSLSITGNGVLDINNNHILITYGSSDPMSAVYGYLKSGFNGGAWNGLGINSSVAATEDATVGAPKYGIGFSDGNDKISGHSIVTGLSSGQIELKYTLVGDANLDGTVNGSDFSILAANFGQGYSNWDQGNFLYTPAVNGTDFSALAANFGQGDSGAAASVSQADVAALDAFATANGLPLPTIAAVPEPACVGLIVMAGIGTLARRRRS